MIKAKEFKTLTLQISIFTPLLSFSANKISGNIFQKFSDIFDNTPQFIPLPQDSPAEIPRVILSDIDNKIKMEIAPSRVNLFRFLLQKEDAFDINEFIKITNKVLKEYLNYTSAKVGRLAVVQRLGLTINNPGTVLASHFCKDDWLKEPFDRPEGFQIHAHKKYSLKEFKKYNVNSWVRCQTGFIEPGKKNAITIQQDINTLNEDLDKNEFTFDEIKDFPNVFLSEQKKILIKYFPDE